MFNNYEVKKINNEEVLFLYIDNVTEFAALNKKHKKKNIKSHIDNYIKKQSIKFNGQKIIFVASSIIIGACLLASPLKFNSTQVPNYKYATKIISLNENLDEKINVEELIKDLNKIDDKSNTQNTSKENSSASENNKTTNSSKKPASSIAKPSTNTNSNTTKKPTTNNISSSKPSSSSTNTTNANVSKPSSNNTSSVNSSKPSQNVSKSEIITLKRSNGSTINIELEEYLIGVVAAEMPASFNIEALKAQAIAARTYALKAKENGITLTDTVSTQVYKDNNELKKIWQNSFDTYYNKVKKAVNSTEGLVMYYNNSLINAFYHSTSNGYTEDATAVFGSYPYLKSVDSSVDKNVSSYLKTVTLSYKAFSDKLGIPITSVSTISLERNNSNRISKIIIDNNTYDGVKFRTLLGLRSTDFDITLNEENIKITTRGYGHGVGMSQYGAHEYGKLGWSYSKILKHYYSGITIKKFN